MLRRVGLIGDIHCEVARLEQTLALFARSNLDTILSVGDIADGPGDLTKTCELLKEAGVIGVAGNHERWLLKNEMRDLPDAQLLSDVAPETRKYLSALPKTRMLESSRGSVMLCHGLGEDDMACVRPDDDALAVHKNAALWALIRSGKAQFVVNGHSHRAMVRTIEGLTILNAGTLHPNHRPVCSIVDFDIGEMRLFDVGRERVVGAESWGFEKGV